jgi:hypothetical protein
LPEVVAPLKRLPPLCLLPGQTPAKAGQVFVRKEAAHVRANLSHDGRCGDRTNTNNALDQRDRFVKRGEMLLNLLLHLSNGLFQKSNVSQDALEQKAVMRLHSTFQGEPQIRELRA